jgi:hypothetical protein
MRESHTKGLATHRDPESWGGARKGVTQALTGVHAGEALSREILTVGKPTLRGGDGLVGLEANMSRSAIASFWSTPRGPRPSACVENSTRENREIPRTARCRWQQRAASERRRP